LTQLAGSKVRRRRNEDKLPPGRVCLQLQTINELVLIDRLVVVPA